jgi:F-type H+-transporting ATPase subunit c
MRKLMFVLLAIVALSIMVTPALAQTPAAEAAKPLLIWVPIAAGFGMAIAAGMAALGQGRVGSSACEGMARNPAARPGIQVAMILSLAFIESLVLFTFVMIFLKAT